MLNYHVILSYFEEYKSKLDKYHIKYHIIEYITQSRPLGVAVPEALGRGFRPSLLVKYK